MIRDTELPGGKTAHGTRLRRSACLRSLTWNEPWWGPCETKSRSAASSTTRNSAATLHTMRTNEIIKVNVVPRHHIHIQSEIVGAAGETRRIQPPLQLSAEHCTLYRVAVKWNWRRRKKTVDVRVSTTVRWSTSSRVESEMRRAERECDPRDYTCQLPVQIHWSG